MGAKLSLPVFYVVFIQGDADAGQRAKETMRKIELWWRMQRTAILISNRGRLFSGFKT